MNKSSSVTEENLYATVKRFSIIGIIFTTIVGSLSHFLYEWSNYNRLVGLFCPVNESTWEHLKLLFFPLLLFTIIEYFYYGFKKSNFIYIKTLSALIGMSSIITIFYTYSGVLGKNLLWMDILTFIISVIIAYLYSGYMILHSHCKKPYVKQIGILIFLFITICFFVFTYYPPSIGLFQIPE